MRSKLTETLDPRLKTIAGQVRAGARLADVGCDHGYLISALTHDGIIAGGIACDINPKPLGSAKKEIARRGLEGLIECRLGSGLEPVGCDEADDIVIAGMGGELIASILETSGWKSLEGKRFILQPMSRIPFLRRWLCNNGYSIESERTCLSNRRVYTVMSVVYTGKRRNVGEYDLYCYMGELGGDRSGQARDFLLRTLADLKNQRMGAGISDGERAQKLSRLIDKLSTVIEEGR